MTPPIFVLVPHEQLHATPPETEMLAHSRFAQELRRYGAQPVEVRADGPQRDTHEAAAGPISEARARAGPQLAAEMGAMLTLLDKRYSVNNRFIGNRGDDE